MSSSYTAQLASDDRLALLGEAARLLTSSLDVEDILPYAAALLVPRLADFCAIYLVEDRQLRLQYELGGENPRAGNPLFREFCPLDSSLPTAEAVRTGGTIILRDTGHVIVPLRVEDRVLGVVVLGHENPRSRFHWDDGGMAEQAVSACALAISNAERNQAIRRQLEDMQGLVHASRILAEPRDLNATLAAIPEVALATFGDHAQVYLLENDRTVPSIPSSRAEPAALPEPVLSVLNSGEPVIVTELSAHPAVILPLRGRTGVLGAIVFAGGQPSRRYSAQDLTRFQDFADRCALAVDNARNFDALQQARARFEFLSRASLVLAESLDYESTLRRVAELPVPSLGDRGVVVLLENGELRWVAQHFHDPEVVRLLETVLKPIHATPEMIPLFQEVLEKGGAVVARNRGEGQLPACPPELKEVALRVMAQSAMAAPMVFQGNTIGFLSVGSKAPNAFRPEDADLLQDLANRCALAIANARNFTRAERERARFQRLVESGTIGIIISRGDIILEANQAFLSLIGYRREEIIDNPDFALLTAPEDRSADERAADERSRTGKFAPFEKEYIRKDGGRTPVLIGGAALDPEDSEWVAFVLDLTERKLLEERVRHSQKLQSLGVLAGGVAHDFNNLLTGIIGSANLAADNAEPGSLVSGLLQAIQEAGEKAALLTRQLLAYSGKGKFFIEVMDLSDFAARISALILAAIPKTVRVHLQLAPNLPAIETDPSQIQQLIMNLVMNGAEAAGDGPGEVWVSTHACNLDERDLRMMFAAEHAVPGRYVCLEVRDTGCGMTPETISKIFDPFFTTKFTGRGLGMSAVLGIIRGHHGAVRIESTAGKGSTFQVFFPASERSAEVVSPEKPRARQGTGTILVVDDEATVRNLAKAALNKSGYTVVLALDGHEAVERIEENPAGYDLILLDMTMPVMDGREALRRIRQISGTTPVIGSSGFSEAEALERFGVGISGVLLKPYRAAELVEAVQNVLAHTTPRQ